MEAFCGNEGEILVSAFKDDICFEVTVEPNRTFVISIERGDDRISFDEGRSLVDVEAKLREVMRQKWISSVGFGQITGTRAKIAGQALHLGTGQALVEAHP